ncbi:MAG TPA: phosphodiester glycosidase family protein [Verrucomicrobiota bacterium]|nr:hypothetical protein [Verrucomicrobiales bacterium]HRI12055.1 phosphodiester glycosidase family protein [Verrucomicrobiota bacterium]
MPTTCTRLWFASFCRALAVLWTVVSVGALASADGTTNGLVRTERGFGFQREEIAEGPWVAHIFRFDRSRSDLVLTTTLGDSNRLGMSTISEQMRAFPSGLGRPLAALNGDFYKDEQEIPGDPRDLQIRHGELISAPAGHACFWMDAAGNPHCTNVQSRLRVIWPDATETPIGLNELRENDAAVLYTGAAGAATPDRSGTELVLEKPGTSSDGWLPLRPGRKVQARVREVRKSGVTPLDREILVLSVGPKLTAPATVGSIIQIVPETVPDLTGVTTAIGGGPTLVRNGKAMEWSGFLLRHPRSAVGWNQDQIFLVEVDGRQSQSVGMTFPELADFLVKLGCQNAMNLDGGGSATMWVFGQVMNSPSEGQERPGANALVVLLKKPEPGQVGR